MAQVTMEKKRTAEEFFEEFESKRPEMEAELKEQKAEQQLHAKKQREGFLSRLEEEVKKGAFHPDAVEAFKKDYDTHWEIDSYRPLSWKLFDAGVRRDAHHSYFHLIELLAGGTNMIMYASARVTWKLFHQEKQELIPADVVKVINIKLHHLVYDEAATIIKRGTFFEMPVLFYAILEWLFWHEKIEKKGFAEKVREMKGYEDTAFIFQEGLAFAKPFRR